MSEPIPASAWRKASVSAGNGQCVEVAAHDGSVAVRDSKDPDGPVLRFTAGEWAAWLDGAKGGEFDDLVGAAPLHQDRAGASQIQA